MQLDKYCENVINISSNSSLKLCNPSIIMKDNQWIVLVRGIDNDLKKRNRNGFFYNENWIYIYDESFSLKEKYPIDDSETINNNIECSYGLEDGRIFEWNNSLWIIFSGLNIVEKKFINTICLCQLENKKLTNYIVLNSPFEQKREKNWIPLVIENELYLIYKVNPLLVYKYQNQELKLVSENYNKKSKYYISGSSTAIPYNDDFLFVTHHREKINIFYGAYLKLFNKKVYKKKKILFYHQFHLIDKSFKNLFSSKKFNFEKLGIEFCAGIAKTSQDMLMSFGVDDEKAQVYKLSLKLYKNIVTNYLGLNAKGWSEILINNSNEVKMDLLLLNFNNFDQFGRKCLDSIYNNQINNTTVFVLDNGSQDDSVEKIKTYNKNNKFNFTSSDLNLGFAKGMNLLAKQGTAEWLLLVNSDVILPKNTLSDFSNILANLDQSIGAVGTVTNNSGNEQKYLIQSEQEDQIISELLDITCEKTNLIFDAYRLDFCFVAIRRNVWEELNGLDESFGLGYYEDFDFCLRVKELGKRVVFTEDVAVYHYGSGSFSSNTKTLIKSNKLKILKKHPNINFLHIRDANLEILKKYQLLEETDQKFKKILYKRKESRINHLKNNYPKSIFKKIQWLWKVKEWI